MKKNTFFEYVETNYRNDPRLIFDRFFDQACAFFLAEADIDLRRSLGNRSPSFTNDSIQAYYKGKTGKAMIWFNVGTRNDGVKYPKANAHVKGAVEINEFWNEASDLLWEEFLDQRTSVVSESAVAKKRAEVKLWQEATDKKQKADEAEQARKEAAKYKCFKQYAEIYEQAPSASGADEYSKRKQMGDIVSGLKDIKYLQKNASLIGERVRITSNSAAAHLSIPAYTDFDRQHIAGFERIFDDKKMQITPKQKALSSAFYLIGAPFKQVLDDDDAKIYITEGFATGCSIYKAAQKLGQTVCVIVCFSVSRITKIAERCYKQITEHPVAKVSKVTIFADNDCYKDYAGNPGLRVGFDLAIDYGFCVKYPSFSDKSALPTDYNDLHCLVGLDYVCDDIVSNDSVLNVPKCNFEKALLKLSFAAKTDKKKLKDCIKSAISAATRLIPELHTNQIFAQIESVYKDVDRAFLAENIRRQVYKTVERANSSRAFTRSTLDDHKINYQKIPAEMNEHGHPVVPMSVLKQIEDNELSGQRGIYVIKSGMGTAKTERVIVPLAAKHTHVIAACHRRSLVADMFTRINDHAEVLNAEGVVHYESCDAEYAQYVPKIAVCINSLPKFKALASKVDLLAVDEAAQVLSAIARSRTVTDKVDVYDQLAAATKAAKTVVMADADANDTVIDFLKQHRPDEVINVIEVVAPTGITEGKKLRVYDDKNQLVMKICEAIEARQNVYVATDSSGESLCESIKEELVFRGQLEDLEDLNDKTLLINSDRSTQESAFFENANEAVKKYRMVITSPSVSSGVSITNDHFHQVFAVLNGVVRPSDALQMLARVRQAKDISVSIKASNIIKETSADALIYNRVLSEVENLKHREALPEDGKIEIKLTNFDLFAVSNEKIENCARERWRQNFLLQAIAIGWSVDFDRSIAPGDVQERLRLSAREAKDQRIKKIATAKDIDSIEAKALRYKDNLTLDETYQLEKYNVQNTLSRRELSEEDYKFVLEDRGSSKIRNFELLLGAVDMNAVRANRFDAAQSEAKVTLTLKAHKCLQSFWALKVIDTLGLSLNPLSWSIDGMVDSKDISKAFEQLKADDAFTRAVQALGMRDPKKVKCASSYFKAYFERFGLKLRQKKSNGYMLRYICDESVKRMLHTVKCRKTAEIEAQKNYKDAELALSSSEHRFSTFRVSLLAKVFGHLNVSAEEINGDQEVIVEASSISKAATYLSERVTDLAVAEELSTLTELPTKDLLAKAPEALLRLTLDACLIVLIDRKDGSYGITNYHKLRDRVKAQGLSDRSSKPSKKAMSALCTDKIAVNVVVEPAAGESHFRETSLYNIYTNSKVSPRATASDSTSQTVLREIETALRYKQQQQFADSEKVTSIIDWLSASKDRLKGISGIDTELLPDLLLDLTLSDDEVAQAREDKAVKMKVAMQL